MYIRICEVHFKQVMNMKKKMIGIIALGTFLLLAGCSSKGEVKRDAHGRKVLSGYITLSGAFALYPLAIQWVDEFHRLPTRWILRW